MNSHVARSFIVLVLLASGLSGQSSRYSNPEFHYSFSIPDDWEQIPNDILAEASSRLREVTGKTPPKFQAGFQRKADEWLAYPHVLLIHYPANSATFTEMVSQLANSKDKAVENVKNLNLLSNIKVGEPVTDPKRFIVFMSVSADTPGGGTFQGLSAMKPGRDGLVQLTLYATPGSYAGDLKSFDGLLDSFKFASGYEYSATIATVRKFDWIGWGALKGVLIGAAIGAIRYILSMLKKRGKPAATTPDN